MKTNYLNVAKTTYSIENRKNCLSNNLHTCVSGRNSCPFFKQTINLVNNKKNQYSFIFFSCFSPFYDCVPINNDNNKLMSSNVVVHTYKSIPLLYRCRWTGTISMVHEWITICFLFFDDQLIEFFSCANIVCVLKKETNNNLALIIIDMKKNKLRDNQYSMW